MLRKSFLTCCLSLSAACLLHAADATSATGAKLSATAIVDNNVAARGGLTAWRSVQTMSLEGKLGAGGNQRSTVVIPGTGAPASKDAVAVRPTEEVYLPFILELQRPKKMRFELQFRGQTAVQVFDGSNGWKFRPFLNRQVVEPYTSDELRVASLQADLDGVLVDYAAKGSRVALDGMEKVENRDTYRIKVTMKSGQALHVWLDSQTFLETKIEGQPRRLDGIDHPVEVYFSDYRPVSGLQIPFALETKVLPLSTTVPGLKETRVPSEKTIIEKVIVNPKLDPSLFSKEKVEVASNAP